MGSTQLGGAGTPHPPRGTSAWHPPCRGAKRPSLSPGLAVLALGVTWRSPWPRARQGAAWHPLPGTACSAALTPSGALCPPPPGPGGPQRPRVGGAVVASPGPSPAVVPLPDPPLPPPPPHLCVSDHREAPGTHPQPRLPGGGDAVPVPGTQVPRGSHRPARRGERADTGLMLVTPVGCGQAARPPAALPPLGLAEASPGDVTRFAMTTGGLQRPSWSGAEGRAKPPPRRSPSRYRKLRSGATAGGGRASQEGLRAIRERSRALGVPLPPGMQPGAPAAWFQSLETRFAVPRTPRGPGWVGVRGGCGDHSGFLGGRWADAAVPAGTSWS